MSLTTQHWNGGDREALSRAHSYADLLAIAKDVISRMHQPVAQVCGPISTGGLGSMEKNIERLGEVVDGLEKQGVEIFNQVPFQLRMQEIRRARGEQGYDFTLLDEFYLPLFEQKFVRILYFLPDWETSTGSVWEHEQANRIGMQIVYL